MPMLHRIEMNVIGMAHEIAFVTQGVLPVASLPDAALALAAAARGNPFAKRQGVREPRFDQAPARGEIRVALPQGPDRVQVIGKYDNRLDRKRVIGPCPAKCRTQSIYVFREEARLAIQQIDREEEAAACDEIASVPRHGRRIPSGEVMGFA